MKYCHRFFGALLLILLVFGSAPGQIEKDEAEDIEFREVPLSDKARIEFDHTVFDFGSIKKGASVAHSYWFTNTGTETLEITRIKPTCGCTVTKKGGIKAEPGERAFVDIIFNSGKFNGRVTKAIKLETNDKINPYMDIRFKSTINDPLMIFDFTPFQADFKEVPSGLAANFKIIITNNDSTTSKLLIVDKPQENFIQANLSRSEIEPEGTTSLELVLSESIKPGEYLSSITLEAEGKRHSRFTIPISLIITEEKASK
jgi:hypothetical protein